jgi:hypothetical protein
VVKLGELVMILDLHRQGLSVSAISRQLGIDRKTVRCYVARGLEPPKYKPRAPQPGIIDPFRPYLAGRITSFPALTARRLWRELKAGLSGWLYGPEGGGARSSGRRERPLSRSVSRRRPASRRRSIWLTSRSCSPMSRV